MYTGERQEGDGVGDGTTDGRGAGGGKRPGRGQGRVSTPNPPPPVTWGQVVLHAPRLAQLKRRVEFVRDDRSAPYFCASEHWYGAPGQARGLRDELAAIVGPDARPGDPLLGRVEAYQVAAARLRALLPPCRACTCGSALAGGWSR